MHNPRTLRILSSSWGRLSIASAVLGLALAAASRLADIEAKRQEHMKAMDDKGVTHARRSYQRTSPRTVTPRDGD